MNSVFCCYFSVRCIRSGFIGFLLSFAVFAANAQEKPDFSGLWMPHGFNVARPAETLLNDYAKPLYDDYVANFETADDPRGFCIKPGLPRTIWDAAFPIEIVQTEKFINIFWEAYFQYRKIYLEGYERPEPILHTRMGYSVGHWEGETLVVETTHLREFPYMRRTPNTNDATTVERIWMETRTDENGNEQHYIVNNLTLTDPRLYIKPVVTQAELISSPDTPIMEYSCTEAIYDQYLLDRGLQLPVFDE